MSRLYTAQEVSDLRMLMDEICKLESGHRVGDSSKREIRLQTYILAGVSPRDVHEMLDAAKQAEEERVSQLQAEHDRNGHEWGRWNSHEWHPNIPRDKERRWCQSEVCNEFETRDKVRPEAPPGEKPLPTPKWKRVIGR